MPRPVKAVILCFPYEGFEEKRKEEDQINWQNDLPVIWIKQKVCNFVSPPYGFSNSLFEISNACGTIGLLHALLNVRIDLDELFRHIESFIGL